MHVRELQRIEPVTAMTCLADRPQLTFLDSVSGHELQGRHSYLACAPFSTFHGRGEKGEMQRRGVRGRSAGSS